MTNPLSSAAELNLQRRVKIEDNKRPPLPKKAFLAKLDSFAFQIGGVEYDSIKRSFDFNYAKIEPLNKTSSYQSTGSHEETITISGHVLLRKINELEPLIKLAKEKKPVLFVTGYGEIFSKVLILSLEIDQESFITEGIYLKQEFSLKLVKV